MKLNRCIFFVLFLSTCLTAQEELKIQFSEFEISIDTSTQDNCARTSILNGIKFRNKSILGEVGINIAAYDPSGGQKFNHQFPSLNSDTLIRSIKCGLSNDIGINLETLRYSDIFEMEFDLMNDHILGYIINDTIDNPNEKIYAWPGRENPHFEAYYGDVLPPQTLSFYNHEIPYEYNPDNGDFPLVGYVNSGGAGNIKNIIPNKIASWFLTSNLGDGNYLGIPVRYNYVVTAYNYLCNLTNIDMHNTLFFHVRTHNKLSEDLLFSKTGIHFLGINGQENNFLAYDSTLHAIIGYPDPESNENLMTVISHIDLQVDFEDESFNFKTPDRFNHFDLEEGKVTDGPRDVDGLFDNLLGPYWNDGTYRVKEAYGHKPSSLEKASYSFDGNFDGTDSWTEINAGNEPGVRNGILVYEQEKTLPGEAFNYLFAITMMETDDGLPDKQRIDDLKSFFYTYRLTNQYMDCESITTPIFEENKSKFKPLIFPNPSSGVFQVQLERSADLYVYDVSGKLISQFHCSDFECQLHIETKGIFFLKMISDNITYTQKLIVH